MAPATTPEPVIRDIIESVLDRKRMAAGIAACATRRNDFASELEMQLAGIAMVPEARDKMTEALTEYWAGQRDPRNLEGREAIIGAGYHAAVYAASRVAAGFPKPVVLERASAGAVGGAFAVSMRPVFRLNSRSRPGPAGLPDQDKALNFLPGAPLQPAMISSEEYPDNAVMAWLIRIVLAQCAEVYPGVTVTRVRAVRNREIQLFTTSGTLVVNRVIDARGSGEASLADSGGPVLDFFQFMNRMGGMFPLRGMRQVAVIGGGNSGLCAAESLLGIAPGNTSAIGLDYVTRVDLYAPALAGSTCSEFREGQRGRYIRLAQFLSGNASNPSTRLRVISEKGYSTGLPDGVLVNERTYDLAINCTGLELPRLDDTLSYFPVTRGASATAIATQASPIESYRVGPAANISLTAREAEAGLSGPSKLAMFRLGPRTAALATMLPGVTP